MRVASAVTSLLEHVRSWSFQEYGIAVLILVASFLRFWNVPNSLQFLGDQGRDASIVSDIFRKGDLVFIGPVTSVGNMYLGPGYYYFMAPFLALTYPSPLGPAYAVAVIGILTTALVYILGKEMVGKDAATIATFIVSFSSVVVTYSRFSWNPNIAPLFGLILVWACFKAWKTSGWYWLLVGLSFSFLLQLHYLTLLALPAAGIIWLLQLKDLFNHRNQTASPKHLKNFVLGTLGAIVITLLSLTPLALFDFKHDWLNSRAFIDLLTSEDTIGGTASGLTKLTQIIKETHGRSMGILFDIFLGQSRLRNTIFVMITVMVSLHLLFKKKLKFQKGFTVIVVFIVMTILGASVYQHTLFDHYLGYMFAVTPLLLGSLLALAARNTFGKVLLAAMGIWFIILQIPRYPLKSLGWTVSDMKRTAQVVAENQKPGVTYSLILLSESRDLYGQNYRFFLNTTNTPPLAPEQFNRADKLVIISENQPIADITQLPIYEIQTFPSKEIKSVYTVDGGPTIIELERAQ